MNVSAQNMVTRQINAKNSFVRTVCEKGFTRDEAELIARVYAHIGVLAFDAVDGQYYIRHGAMLDNETMRNALAGAETAMASRKVNWKRRR